MKHDPEHLLAIAMAQHRANKLAMRRLQYRRRMEGKTEKFSHSVALPWLQAVERDDRRDEVLEMLPEPSNFAEVPA